MTTALLIFIALELFCGLIAVIFGNKATKGIFTPVSKNPSLTPTDEEKKDEPAPTAIIIDMDDPVQQAKFQHEEMMKKLNPPQ